MSDVVAVIEKLDDLYGRILADPTCPSTHLAELTKLVAGALLAIVADPRPMFERLPLHCEHPGRNGVANLGDDE